jgi:hypothetical protein
LRDDAEVDEMSAALPETGRARAHSRKRTSTKRKLLAKRTQRIQVASQTGSGFASGRGGETKLAGELGLEEGEEEKKKREERRRDRDCVEEIETGKQQETKADNDGAGLVCV